MANITDVVSCSKCDGTGQMTCPDCGGDGCNECGYGGSGTVTCSECNGSGKIEVTYRKPRNFLDVIFSDT